MVKARKYNLNFDLHSKILLACLLVFIALYSLIFFKGSFIDEHENFSAGWFITQGILPYQDYFTHHGPSPYYLAAAIFAFTQFNPLLIRLLVFFSYLAFGISAFWYVKPKHRPLVGAILIFAALASPLLLTHMYLASTLAGLGFVWMIIRLHSLNPDQQSAITNTLILQIVLGSFLTWASPIYFVPWLILMGYSSRLIGFNKLTTLVKRHWLKLSLITLLAWGWPLFVYSRDLSQFIWHVFTYNTQYYYPLRLNNATDQSLVEYLLLRPLQSYAIQFQTFIVNTRIFLQTLLNIMINPDTQFFKLLGVTLREYSRYFFTLSALSFWLLCLGLANFIRSRQYLWAITWLTLLMSLKVRDNELFHLAPYYLVIMAGGLISLIISQEHEYKLTVITLTSLLVLFAATQVTTFNSYVTSYLPIIPPEVVARASQIKASGHEQQTLLNLSADSIYYPLSESQPAGRIVYQFPWIYQTPQLAAEITKILQNQGADVIIIEPDPAETVLYPGLVEILQQGYQEKSNGIYERR